MQSLHDVFETLDKKIDKPASYVLQTLWRDCTSDFDFIGPYFLNEKKGFEHKYLITCLRDTIKMGEIYGFGTGLVIVDGVTENLAMIKALVGHYNNPRHTKRFQQYHHGTPSEQHFVPCSMENPHRADRADGPRIYFIICLSHELKNLVAAVYSSRVKGAKKFCSKWLLFRMGSYRIDVPSSI
eukprot:Pompholyxophrys_punicea_v1_NODE_402_length_2054_cov_4.557279.p2 type:complete len:183 gc:universal NODE_402_length_2054_cov_4.557279:1184-636(-)